MNLLARLKSAFNPKSHDATLSHYIPAIQYADSGAANSIWQTDLMDRVQDWKGDTGRIYNQQVLTTQGPLMFALDGAIVAGLGGTSITFGQGLTPPVAGFAGRSPQLDETSIAAEYDAVQT
jgi:hypothetical protein